MDLVWDLFLDAINLMSFNYKLGEWSLKDVHIYQARMHYAFQEELQDVVIQSACNISASAA